jgi:hypothetical protein
MSTTTPALKLPTRRGDLLRWIGGGALVVAAIVAIAIAVWPASEADKAREDGKQVGEAVSALYGATSAEEVDAALTDLDTAIANTREHAGDRVGSQVDDQADALSRAADGFVGVHTTDGFDQDLYQAELDTAVDDLTTQADDFRTEGPEVQQAFWNGVEEGLPATN